MIGIDVVDITHMREALRRTPQIERRLFTGTERHYCTARRDPVVHLAGTLAAKEAVVKALALPGLWGWARRIEVRRASSGAPEIWLDGSPAEGVCISISHHGAVAVAVAVDQRPPREIPRDRSASSPARRAS